MDTSELLKTLQAAANTPTENLSEQERQACLAACNKLHEKLETPHEALFRFLFGTHNGAALRLGVDMKLLENGVAAKGPITIDELATKASAGRDLVCRVMRMLTGMKLFQETGMDTFVANPLAAAYVAPSPLEAAIISVGCFLPAVASLPNYFAEKGYRSPGDAYDGPWQYQFQTKDHYFDWTFKRPKESEAFNTLMTISRLGRGDNWFEFYPVEERLRVQTDDAILLVDVGGSIGHDVIAFKKQFPNLKGRLIIEDLPNVVSEVKDVPAGIETVGHDFFKPQPDTVKGAKAYYLRTVLHDWPNKQSKVILKHIRDVMSRDSVLLLNENSIPDTNAPLISAQGDLSMMAMFASLDRTEKQFAELLDEAGFELVKVWRPKVMYPMSAVLFEAILKD